jgi:[glutamine synthetase] adenylyltransferase / [glutamine synthetase]-adenylyl-L-tyrosine phosphorylase
MQSEGAGDALSRSFVEGLEHGTPDPKLLAIAGEPEPAGAALAFVRAAQHPDLAPQIAHWAPALLLSARPGFGAARLHELAGASQEACGAPLELVSAPGIVSVLGASNFLARLLVRNPALVRELQGPIPEPPSETPSRSWSAIRLCKYRGLLRIAARDLLGRPFGESPRELSDLADRCLGAALACAADETSIGPATLLALGKLGGRELNFSSDVDLLFLYDAPSEAEDAVRNAEVARLVRAFKAGLEQPTEESFAYRVDLDLRPEGPHGALANSVNAALDYYESFGMEWERQMLIRLRFVAGPEKAARTFEREIAPFVFRRLIDPGVARAVRAMKARIEDERRRAGRDLDADLKEGPGGIRDVEFLVQAFQLFHGGRLEVLRRGSVLEALAVLGRLALLPDTAVTDLSHAYTWLRRAEHALQMVEERQTQGFPRERFGQIALARRMGYAEPEGERARDRLLEEWTTVRSRVRAQFEALVLGEGDNAAA